MTFKTVIKIFIGLLMLISQESLGKNPSAIEWVKQHPKVQTLVSQHNENEYQTTYSELSLGGQCGFAGCDWYQLVSVVITAKRANNPSMTILAKVSGQTPDRGNAPKIEFVELTAMDEKNWQSPILLPQ